MVGGMVDEMAMGGMEEVGMGDLSTPLEIESKSSARRRLL